jgi:hypothetical protein
VVAIFMAAVEFVGVRPVQWPFAVMPSSVTLSSFVEVVVTEAKSSRAIGPLASGVVITRFVVEVPERLVTEPFAGKINLKLAKPAEPIDEDPAAAE